MSVKFTIEVDDVTFTCSEDTARKLLAELQRVFGSQSPMTYPPGVSTPDPLRTPWTITC